MLHNYFKTAIRILLRQKAYSAINIFGLTLGITCSLLIILYIVDEFSYDRFHSDADRIYRTTFTGKLQGQDFASIQTGVPMAEALRQEIPQVESTLRLFKRNTYPVRQEEKSFTEKRFLVADSNFFRFFNFELISGNAGEVLKGPNKLVITESAAKKYFGYKGKGDTGPLGKIFTLGSQGEQTAEVTGIAADPPANSHIRFDMILSMESWDGLKESYWLNSAVVTYFKLQPGTPVDVVNKKYNFFIEKYCALELEKFLNVSLKQFKEQGGNLGYGSQSLKDIHLHSQLSDELEPNGNIQYVYLFGAIAGFIILLACINFMNLSTARSANRAKEVGVRKTLGAFRRRLIGQFLIESYLYTIIGVLFAMLVIYLALAPFNVLTGKELTLSLFTTPYFLIGIVGFILLVGLIAGSYPAFYLTAFKPVEVLKGKVRAGMKSSGIRNSLVVFQFFISIGLIICTLIVYKQLKFVQEKNLGFDKENVVDLLHTMRLDKAGEAFKNELLQHPEIIAASYANRLPPNIDWNSVFSTVGATQQDHLLSIYLMDYDHLKTMGYRMQAGRFFSRDFPADSSKIIINETASKQMGFEDFEGKKLISHFNTNSEKGKEVEVIGIMKDFNFESLHSPIKAMVMILAPQPYYEMGIRLTPGNPSEKLKVVEQVWKKYAPGAPFEYSFLNQNYDAKFRAEERMGQIFIVFTSLAVLIACLGLFGLATFTAEQRAKEISIRKVLGASISQVVVLLSKDFAKLVMLAFLIAIPITWYGMTKWLEGFAYRISFDVLMVVVAGGLAILVAIITISFQAIKAALGNPVDSLKNE
jgi:putative ABC transport system permease protein